MRFYQTQHPFYCGVDLHATTMRVCFVNQTGRCSCIANCRPAAIVSCRSSPAPAWQEGLVGGQPRRRGRQFENRSARRSIEAHLNVIRHLDEFVRSNCTWCGTPR